MVEIQARVPLQGVARPGRFGAVGAMPGLIVEERIDLALASVIARRGRERDLKDTVAKSFGIELPDGPRVAANGAISFAGIGLHRWFTAAENAAHTDFVARLQERLAGLASISDQTDGRVVAASASGTCWQRAFRWISTTAASRPATLPRPWWPILAYRLSSLTMRQRFSSWPFAALLEVCGHGWPSQPRNSAMRFGHRIRDRLLCLVTALRRRAKSRQVFVVPTIQTCPPRLTAICWEDKVPDLR
jgi:hypothetical protein